MDKKILKQLKSDYEEFEIKPSTDLWDQIDSGLDSSSETIQKVRFDWWQYAAVIILLLSVVGLFYFNSDKPLDIKRTVVVKNPLRNNFKPTETVESIIPKEKINEKSIYYKTDVIDDQMDLISEKPIKKLQVPDNLEIIQKEADSIKILSFAVEKLEIPILKTFIAKKKKHSYTNADDLLLGRELDKTRVEIKNQRQFGVLDASKLKFKRPSSLQIFGVHVFADSIISE